jgi:uncharacterized protein (TIGR03435 family)
MRTVALLVAAGVASGAQAPSFEVATVKVNRTGSGRSGFPQLRNGRLTADNATLKQILQVAYGLSALQIGGPAWLDSDRFDIMAKSPEGVAGEVMPMLQSLLKDRFQLAAHIESREMPVYDLIVGNEGLKIALFDPAHIPPTPPRNGAASMIIGGMTMAGLAGALTPAAGRPVLDRTGLEGRYYCAVTFSPLAAADAGDGPLDIFAAVQRQLGLKLEPKKAALDFLVVEHVERVPREN